LELGDLAFVLCNALGAIVGALYFLDKLKKPSDNITPEKFETKPFTLTCPYCSTPIRSDVKHEGQTVTCVSCGAHVRMPLTEWQQLRAAIFILASLIIALLMIYRGYLFLKIANM
jgi:hypothetical protein